MKICIIKLGADGDVIRTLPIARALKERYKDAHITWVTRGDVASLLNGVPYIDNVLTLPYTGLDKYDRVYNFDIDYDATKLASELISEKKYGFYDDSGYPAAFTIGGEYYLNTMFDDDLKKTNKKTYQEMMFEAAEIPYKNEFCGLYLNEEDKKHSLSFLKTNGLEGKRILGIHMGSGSRWPSKAWHSSCVKEFIKIAKRHGYEIILFGGPNEIEEHENLVREMDKEGVKVHRNNPRNSKRQFMSIVNLCKAMVCSDSFALHVSVALKKKTIGLFFCTSPDEVEDYGFLRKILSPKLYDFFPERSNEYNEELVKSISPEDVFKALEN